MRPRTPARLCSLCVALAVACGGEKKAADDRPDGGSQDDAGEPAGDADGGPELPSEVVDFETDDEAAVTASISALIGGQIEAVASDGTVFVLDVPPFALASDVEVTVLPLLTVLGISETGPVHGVQLSPEGLHFQALATLTVTPAEPIAPENLLAFQAQGGGSSPGAALLDVSADGVLILFDRLSVTGIASVSEDERATLFALATEDPELLLRHRVGEALQAAWHERLAGGAPTFPDLSDVFERYEDGALAAASELSDESCDTRASYLDAALDYAQLAALVDAAPSSAAAYRLLAVQQGADAACEEEVVSVCRTSQEPGYLLEYRLRALRVQHVLETVGLVSRDGAADDLPAHYQAVQATCAMGGYTVSGGGDGLTVSGELDDPNYPFALSGEVEGTGVTLVFSPDADNGNRGSYEYESGAVSGSGNYTLSELDDGALSLDLMGFRCLSDVCDAITASITFTPE